MVERRIKIATAFAKLRSMTDPQVPVSNTQGVHTATAPSVEANTLPKLELPFDSNLTEIERRRDVLGTS